MDIQSSQERLAEAEKICLKRNVRMTPQRLKVLKLLMLQPNAISAYDLLDLLRESEPQAKPPTVYRALDFLLAQGFVHKVESTNSYVLCHLFNPQDHTSALFICDHCGNISEKSVAGVESTLRTLADSMQFAPHHNVIEVHGLCCNCQQLPTSHLTAH